MKSCRLIGALGVATASGVASAARSALARGADCVEIRLDGLYEGESDRLSAALEAFNTGCVVLTCRSRAEGGASALTPKERYDLIRRLVGPAVLAVDVEWADVQASGGWSDLSAEVEARVDIVVSKHSFGTAIPQPDLVLKEIEDACPGAVAKVAWRCDDVSENLGALDCMGANAGRRIVICMGEKGILSRVLARKCRAWGSFAATDSGSATAPGQLTVEEMLGTYRWASLNAETQVYGVIGSPVAQSLSPLIFNDQFAAAGLNAVYLPILIDDADELARFLDGCTSRPWLDVCGFSVTAPHKEAALAWAADRAEPLAARIGAANTLCMKDVVGPAKTGAIAYNTDYAGALAALGTGASIDSFDGLNAAVLGAGGVARAVVAGLRDRGARVTVYNRSAERGAALAEAFGAVAASWDQRASLTADVVVNCTSLGMAAKADVSPLPADALRSSTAVFDTVYNPVETALLRDARRAGCRVVDGVAMFVHQAAAQFRLWTGLEPDVGRMRELVLRRLAERAPAVEDSGATS